MDYTMFELPPTELITFATVIVMYASAAVVGVLQLSAGGENYKPILTHLFTIAVVLEAILLVFRAIAIQAVPLTGLFESMIVLTLVFGLTYLVLGLVIRQVWFGSVVTWVILAMIVLTAFIAVPATKPHDIAGKPWAIAHGLAMIFGTAMILLSAVTASIYLLGTRRLKHKQIMKVIGVVPNIQKLERLNYFGLKVAFIFLTLGLISGMGGAYLEAERLDKGFLDWLTDGKIIGITITWLLLGLILAARHFRLIRGKHTAYISIVIFVLGLFALIGVTFFGTTGHDFPAPDAPAKQLRERNP